MKFSVFALAVGLLAVSSAPAQAELRRVEIKTLGMD